ncbi:MAG: hypothetical protein V4508_17410 [Pseudomonadota bacterium]
MNSFRRAAIGALGALALLCGCTTTPVHSDLLVPNQEPMDRVVIVVRPSTIENGATADPAATGRFDQLVPLLSERLPKLFALNGIDAQVLGGAKFRHEPDQSAKPATLRVLTLTPMSGNFNKKNGQVLHFRATLLDHVKNQALWRADIKVTGMGFGSFDQKVADELAVKLLERLRHDKLTRIPAADIRTE